MLCWSDGSPTGQLLNRPAGHEQTAGGTQAAGAGKWDDCNRFGLFCIQSAAAYSLSWQPLVSLACWLGHMPHTLGLLNLNAAWLCC